jgi:hypothetical protein
MSSLCVVISTTGKTDIQYEFTKCGRGSCISGLKYNQLAFAMEGQDVTYLYISK